MPPAQRLMPHPYYPEGEKSCVVKGLPESALARIHRTVSEILDAAMGEGLKKRSFHLSVNIILI